MEEYITEIDFENAFDSVQLEFMFNTLKTINFEENFIKWIKTLYTYTNIAVCAGNNENFSEYFTLSRSISKVVLY